MRFAEVAVNAPVEHGRTFSYSVPPSLDVLPGHLVEVPFGPRTLQGVVFSLAPHPQVPETRDVLGVTYEIPVLSETRLRLGRWISGHYMCSLFEAAAPMLPPGGRIRRRVLLTVSSSEADFRSKELTPYQTRVLEYIAAGGRVTEERLARVLGEAARAALPRLVNEQLVERSYGTTGPSIGPKSRDHVRLASDRPRAVSDLLSDMRKKAPRQAALLARFLEDGALIVLSEARKEYGAGAVGALLGKGLIVKEAVSVDRDPLAGKAFQTTQPVALTPAQEQASAEIRAALDKPSAAPLTFLLQGVTGSGKTEVYLDAASRCLELQKRAIVLVPEIALTVQTIERFAARFPGNVAVLHSKLTPGEQFDQWWKVARGEYGVVIGSRSAIFAPQPDLGLIVIDEEHEWTYKQHDAQPRYHARDVAVKLAELSGARLLLGSASPDVGSYYKAERGRYRLLRLPARVRPVGAAPSAAGNGTGLASVAVVDLRRELRAGNRLMFSRALMRELGQVFEDGSQAILFLNRRGSASHMHCRSCGFSLRCRRCDIGMTYHKEAARLICHYCGDRRKPPARCPQCLSFRLALYGIGTQSVANEVTRQFPGARVLRWDRDTTTGRGSHEDILERFRSAEAQVLVGTQMIAKGLDFPSVTLVGVVSADVGLNVPDYQAGERAFQLLCQVAGRAGRGESQGKVIIQTYQPDNYAIMAAAAQDYLRFYRREIAYRREHGNPPISSLIRLVYAHTNRAKCESEALRFAGFLEQERNAWGLSDVELLGPTPGYPSRLRGRYRWQLVLRGRQPRALLDKVTVSQGWVVDVDPVGLA